MGGTIDTLGRLAVSITFVLGSWSAVSPDGSTSRVDTSRSDGLANGIQKSASTSRKMVSLRLLGTPLAAYPAGRGHSSPLAELLQEETDDTQFETALARARTRLVCDCCVRL